MFGRAQQLIQCCIGSWAGSREDYQDRHHDDNHYNYHSDHQFPGTCPRDGIIHSNCVSMLDLHVCLLWAKMQTDPASKSFSSRLDMETLSKQFLPGVEACRPPCSPCLIRRAIGRPAKTCMWTDLCVSPNVVAAMVLVPRTVGTLCRQTERQSSLHQASYTLRRVEKVARARAKVRRAPAKTGPRKSPRLVRRMFTGSVQSRESGYI